MSDLTFSDHSRANLARRYLYTVVSRRSGGVSIGVNVSTTDSCNWRCAYCQVEGLKRGSSPLADIDLLRTETEAVLRDIVHGQFMQRHVPPDLRVVRDIAFSGNGEPTSCQNFVEAFDAVADVRDAIAPDVPIVIITNGSYLGKQTVRDAMARVGSRNGEIWAKVDAGSDVGIQTVNDVRMPIAKHLANISAISHQVRTRIQSCFVRLPGLELAKHLDAYIEAMRYLASSGAQIVEVQIYTLARPSFQAREPSALSDEEVDDIADRVQALGFAVARAYGVS